MNQQSAIEASGELLKDSQSDVDSTVDSVHLRETETSPDHKSLEEEEDLYGPHELIAENLYVFKCDWPNKLFPSLKQMGFPHRVPVCRAKVTIGEKTYVASVDSGASTIVMARQVYQDQKHILSDLQTLQPDEKLRGGTGAEIDGIVRVPFNIGEFTYSFEAYVGDLVGVPMLQGMPFQSGVCPL